MVESICVCPFPPPPPGAERRIHQRKDVLAQIELERGDRVVIASINNLSLGGAYLLHSDDDVGVGEKVRVHMAAGAVEVIQEARVVRVSRGEHSGFAVKWVDPTARTYAIVERLMNAA